MGETPRLTESSPSAPPPQEPVSVPESEPTPAPEVKPETKADRDVKLEQANKELDQAFQETGENPPEPADLFSRETTPEPPKQEPASQPAVEQQAEPAETMSEADRAASKRIDAIQNKLSPAEADELNTAWQEGGPNRPDKLNEIASRVEQRIASEENQPEQEGKKPEEPSESEQKPGEQSERPEAKAEKSEQKPEEPPEQDQKPETRSPKETAKDSAAFNRLQKQIDSLRRQIEKLQQQKLESEISQLKSENEMLREEVVRRELEQLLSQREVLAEKVTGKNIKEIMAEAERKVAEVLGYSTREDYVAALTPVEERSVKANTEENYINQEWETLSKRQQKKYGNNPDEFRRQMLERGQGAGLSQDETFALLEAGYKPQSIKNKGLFSFRRLLHPFRSEKRIISSDGKKVWMRSKDFKRMAEMESERYNAVIREQASRQLGEKWGSEVRRQTEEFMEKEANDLERAELRTREAYRNQRIKMFSNYLEGLSKKPRTTRGLKSFEARVGRDRDLTSFYDQSMNRTGKLSPMNGDARKNAEAMSDFLDDYGVNVTPSGVRRAFSGGRYERATKKEGGLIALVLDLIKNTLNPRASRRLTPRRARRK